MTANMDIKTSDIKPIVMAMGFLKRENKTKLSLNHHKSFHKNIREVSFNFLYTCKHLQSYKNNGSFAVFFLIAGGLFLVDDLSSLMETSSKQSGSEMYNNMIILFLFVLFWFEHILLTFSMYFLVCTYLQYIMIYIIINIDLTTNLFLQKNTYIIESKYFLYIKS